MCIDNETMLCCQMCSLTRAVWLIAFAEILFLAGAIMIPSWVDISISACVLLSLSFILCFPTSVFVRRFAFLLYLILTILATVAVIFIALVMGFANGRLDKAMKDYCERHPDLYPGRFNTVDDCVSFVRTVSLTSYVLIFALVLIMRVCFCRILYYGLRE
mmetsp:Transcript_22523/g.27840  ORF Transcript_22523/g.27840 Transcript_22523/m.27840 type:complete len:160 (+) Transcript_22523:14-493(+)